MISHCFLLSLEFLIGSIYTLSIFMSVIMDRCALGDAAMAIKSTRTQLKKNKKSKRTKIRRTFPALDVAVYFLPTPALISLADPENPEVFHFAPTAAPIGPQIRNIFDVLNRFLALNSPRGALEFLQATGIFADPKKMPSTSSRGGGYLLSWGDLQVWQQLVRIALKGDLIALLDGDRSPQRGAAAKEIPLVVSGKPRAVGASTKERIELASSPRYTLDALAVAAFVDHFVGKKHCDCPCGRHFVASRTDKKHCTNKCATLYGHREKRATSARSNPIASSSMSSASPKHAM
jgi:hypothetical protein